MDDRLPAVSRRIRWKLTGFELGVDFPQEELQVVQNQLQASQDKLKISKNSRSRLNKIKKRIQLSNDYLREQLGDLQEKMEQKESQVKELVGKVQYLREEVEEFLSCGDSLMEDVGMEPKVPSQ